MRANIRFFSTLLAVAVLCQIIGCSKQQSNSNSVFQAPSDKPPRADAITLLELSKGPMIQYENKDAILRFNKNDFIHLLENPPQFAATHKIDLRLAQHLKNAKGRLIDLKEHKLLPDYPFHVIGYLLKNGNAQVIDKSTNRYVSYIYVKNYHDGVVQYKYPRGTLYLFPTGFHFLRIVKPGA